MAFFGDIYLFFLILLLVSSAECISFECNSYGDFEILVILSAILLPIKSPVASAVFRIVLFEGVFSESL